MYKVNLSLTTIAEMCFELHNYGLQVVESSSLVSIFLEMRLAIPTSAQISIRPY